LARRAAEIVLHASAVAFGARAVLIRGRSGSGKSALALRLMALGGTLVSDDRTRVSGAGDAPVARAPETIRGLIEARGVGILDADTVDSAEIVLVVDLDRTETERLPPRRTTELAGHHVELIHGRESAHFPAAVRQYVIAGRSA
jgi:HPr kinase/phosphorylase